MKKSLLLILIIVLIAFLSGCNDQNEAVEGLFYAAALDTAPVIAAAASRAYGENGGWSLGNVPFEFNEIFKEYDTTDEMSVGINNIYKLLNTAESFFENCFGETGTEAAAVQLSSPFDFGRTAASYDHFYENVTTERVQYFAGAVDGTIQRGLLCWYINDTENEWGIVECSYNDSTGALDLDLLSFCEDATDGNGTLRIKLVGNADAHQFSKLLVGRWGENGYDCSYAGAGYAKENSSGFLLSASDSDLIAAGVTGFRYFDFPADPTIAQLQAINYEGAATSASTHKSTVDALTPFAWDTVTDIPHETADIQAGTGGAVIKPADWPTLE